MILKPIRLWIDTLMVFNDQTFEETASVHKYYSKEDTIGIDIYPSGIPYSIYSSPVELKFPSGEPYLGPEGTNYGYINKNEMYILNKLDTVVYFDDQSMTEKVKTKETACFDIQIGDVKIPLFQADDFVMEMSLDQVNQMLKSKTLSIVSNCESQVGKLNALSIKDETSDFISWAEKSINETISGESLFLNVDLEIEELSNINLVSIRIK
jgi:hypothetical protein